MNGSHHRKLTALACKMAGVARPVTTMLREGAATADYLNDVRVDLPFESPQPKLFGRSLTSLQHFYGGYCWDKDPSLCRPLDALGDVAAWVTRAKVSGTQAPMRQALELQPGANLCDLRFPRLSRVGSHWATTPGLTDQGRALHMAQEVVPHHLWGALLGGHEAWENECERLFDVHMQMFALAHDPNGTLFADTFGALVASHKLAGIATVEALIEANGEWLRAKFGAYRTLSECSNSDMLDCCARAVAATIRALEIMKG